MSQATGFAIEIRERYQDVAGIGGLRPSTRNPTNCCRAGSIVSRSRTASRRGLSPACWDSAAASGLPASICGFPKTSRPGSAGGRRCARGDIGDGDDRWGVGAASAAPARHRASEPFHLAPVLRFVSCQRSRSLFSAVMATGLADFLLPAWLWSAGPMSRLPQRNSAVRPDGPDPAICLRALRFRLARGRQDIGRGGGAAVGTVDRRYLQGGNCQEFVGDPRMGCAPAAHSSRRRRRLRSAARQPVGVGPHPLLRAARAKGRRWTHRRQRRHVRPAPTTNPSRRRP
ncbi:hypothetical protein ABIA00_000222 [Bradyrhizobium ottawaense]